MVFGSGPGRKVHFFRTNPVSGPSRRGAGRAPDPAGWPPCPGGRARPAARLPVLRTSSGSRLLGEPPRGFGLAGARCSGTLRLGGPPPWPCRAGARSRPAVGAGRAGASRAYREPPARRAAARLRASPHATSARPPPGTQARPGGPPPGLAWRGLGPRPAVGAGRAGASRAYREPPARRAVARLRANSPPGFGSATAPVPGHPRPGGWPPCPAGAARPRPTPRPRGSPTRLRLGHRPAPRHPALRRATHPSAARPAVPPHLPRSAPFRLFRRPFRIHTDSEIPESRPP